MVSHVLLLYREVSVNLTEVTYDVIFTTGLAIMFHCFRLVFIGDSYHGIVSMFLLIFSSCVRQLTRPVIAIYLDVFSSFLTMPPKRLPAKSNVPARRPLAKQAPTKPAPGDVDDVTSPVVIHTFRPTSCFNEQVLMNKLLMEFLLHHGKYHPTI